MPDFKKPSGVFLGMFESPQICWYKIVLWLTLNRLSCLCMLVLMLQG